jgi:hypothetical protein
VGIHLGIVGIGADFWIAAVQERAWVAGLGSIGGIGGFGGFGGSISARKETIPHLGSRALLCSPGLANIS